MDWRTTESAFRISFQPDWQNGSGRFHTRDGRGNPSSKSVKIDGKTDG